MVMGGGFVVTDYHQKQILFRVDGSSSLGARDQLVLKDGCGDALLLVRRKVINYRYLKQFDRKPFFILLLPQRKRAKMRRPTLGKERGLPSCISKSHNS